MLTRDPPYNGIAEEMFDSMKINLGQKVAKCTSTQKLVPDNVE